MTSPAKVQKKVLRAARSTTRRTGYSSSTKRALLENATQLFAAHGYAGTSLDEVVAAARVTKGALYHHFPSKLALFESVFDRLQEKATREIEKRIDTADDPWERAQIGLEGFLEVCREPQFRRICLQEGPVALGHERWAVAERAASYGIVKRTVDALLDDLGGANELSEAYAAIFFGAIRSSSEYVADADDAEQASAEVLASISGILAGMRLLPSLTDPHAEA
ncbi:MULTISPECIES: TetR/AcrR family transcriptional regulator [unclassified Aeromicrobium]|uniref:TetR/AcrR family transcriptional regulator n=1 Tax=unclassified Aeromicrobium TaxID=2633570 RepID=UPI002097F9DB|nr:MULTISPECIES: TetR/AcrR family transcriptional regulator [unclassified Aeromicrobium]MCO7239940.1 TetR/AcrR family transcriptional regulator [Aeromicrobium sp. CnD17-E]MDR6120241.1 AcrR family transcriptional regulator [Aeromicrobium sp. SORGH_AS_0981]